MSMAVVRNDEEARKVLRDHVGESFAFDIETTGLNFREDEIVGLALYFESDAAYYLPLFHTDVTFTGETYRRTYLSPEGFSSVVNALLFQHGVEKYAHNGKFDLKFLKRSWIDSVYIPLFRDTLLAAVLLDENRKNGLKSLSETVLGMPHSSYKTLPHYAGFDAEEFLGVPLEHASVYAMTDVVATYKLWQNLRPQLEEQNLSRAFYKMWMPLTMVLTEMEMEGMPLDLEKVREVRDRYELSLAELEKYLIARGQAFLDTEYLDPLQAPEFFWRILTGSELEDVVELEDGSFRFKDSRAFYPTKRSKMRVLEFNPGSSTQMELFLFSIFPEADDLMRTAGGAISTGVSNIETLLFYSESEENSTLLRSLLDYKKADKFLSAFLNPFLDKHDKMNYNSIYTTFNQDVARTGRLSSSGGGADGFNLQQIPSRDERGKEARSMCIAKPGHKLVVADFQQFEIYLSAHFSQDPVLTAALLEGQDLHVLTASTYAGISYQELLDRVAEGDPEAKRLRFIGKSVNFCVPLNTKVLTKRGWLGHDEVQEGDETIGFNLETMSSEWTAITHIQHFSDSPVISMANSYWRSMSTANHRWLTRQRRPERFSWKTTEAIHTDDSVIVSMPLEASGIPDLSDSECALIGWLFTDGSVRFEKFTGAASQGKNGSRTGMRGMLAQKKYVSEARAVLDSVGITFKEVLRADGVYLWYFPAAELRELFEKAGIVGHDDLPNFVLRLSHMQQKAFYGAVMYAEGGKNGRTFSQNEGPMLEAFRLSAFLLGRRVTAGGTRTYVGGNYPHTVLRATTGHVTGQRLEKEELPPERVWCVTTRLGSWTIEQNGHIMTTGNSSLYGVGPRKLRSYILVNNKIDLTLEETTKILKSYNETYAGVSEWKQKVIREIREKGYVTTISGRRRRLPEIYYSDRSLKARAERQGINAKIQGSCGDIIDLAMIYIQEAIRPFDASLLVQVHDELVVQAPDSRVDIVATLIENLMTLPFSSQLRLPLRAEVGIGDNWSSAKE